MLDKTAEALGALVEWRSASQAATIAQAQRSSPTPRSNGGEAPAGRVIWAASMPSHFRRCRNSWRRSPRLKPPAEGRIQGARAAAAVDLERGGIPEISGHPGLARPRIRAAEAPAVASAQARWQSLKGRSRGHTALRQRRNPLSGSMPGAMVERIWWGMTFSIPLNVRNNFSAETRTAERAALEAEARFRPFTAGSASTGRPPRPLGSAFDQQYRSWQTLVQGRVEQSAKLLERQWRSGDLPPPTICWH